MLKIWKKTWKETDPSRRPQLGSESDQEGTLDEFGISSVPLNGFAKTSSSNIDLPSALLHGQAGEKRSRAEFDADSSVSDQPFKKPTTVPLYSLGHHLPEIGRDDKVECFAPHSNTLFWEQALEQAKRENTIVIVPPLRLAAINILVQSLKWAVDLERCRPNMTTIRHRTALMVVDNESSIDRYVSLIGAEVPGFVVGKYNQFIHETTHSWALFLQKDIVIISSHLLLESLTRGTLAITQLHILAICFAQNIRDQDSHTFKAISKVMNDFYHVTDPLSRPRVFVLATPPTDNGFHFDSTMLALESVLDSKVFGITSERRAEILALPDRPNEVVILYNKPSQAVESRLFKQLLYFDSTEAIFKRHFKASRHALYEVGSCASDLIWRRALKEIDATVLPRYEEEEDEADSSCVVQRQIRDLVKNWAFTMPNLDPSSRGFNVTHKFMRFVEILKACESYGGDFRGIVFVQRRSIAFVIVDLLRTLNEQLGFLRPHPLIGHGKLVTPEQQQEVLRDFATGSYNLLVATKSAEDLDIPRATLVIRFDIFESRVSYVYARACAHGHESHLIHMVERANETHRRILSEVMELDVNLLRWTEIICNNQDSPMPPNPLRETGNPYHSQNEDDDDEDTFLQDPTTGGRIYIQDATTVIYRFASYLIRDNESVHSSTNMFAFETIQGQTSTPKAYICTIDLPGTPINMVSSSPSISRAHSRRAACYKACDVLSKLGLLDYRFFPSFPGETSNSNHTLNQAQVDNKTSGTRCYLRKQPDFWTNTGSTPITSLYPTIISTNHTEGARRPYSPLLILTRQALPDLPSFNIFFSGVPSIVDLQKGAPFQVTDTLLYDLYLYTIRLCRVISNKPYGCSIDNVVYFLAPLTSEWAADKTTLNTIRPIEDYISWDLISIAGREYAVPLKFGTFREAQEDIEDAVVQDRWVEFTRRYDAITMRADLSPLSKPPDSPREADYDSLVDFCKARRKGFEGLKDYEQPIIEVSKVPATLNRLNPTNQLFLASTKATAKYLIPELCAKCTIPASHLRTALLLPSITRRIDEFLLVKELNSKFFNHGVSEELLQMAVCAPSAGVEYDYERLELLGDAFLKYLSTIYVFVTSPTYTEGALHSARQNIISNRALHQNACRSGLPAYIQSKPFASKMWCPPNFTLMDPSWTTIDANGQGHSGIKQDAVGSHPQKQAAECSSPLGSTQLLDNLAVSSSCYQGRKRKKSKEDIQWLGDKAIADVAEAIIGAAYMTGGRDTALKITKALKIPISNIEQWTDFGRKVLAPPPNITSKLNSGSIEAIEVIIGHKIVHPHLLAQALTHSSVQHFESTSYERLEFLGDAILDFMVIRHIFDRDQQLSPGGLTLLKGAMVSNSALAAVCVWSGLHEHLLYESYPLATSIQEYATKLEAKQIKEYKLAEQEGRSPGQYWLDLEPPKVLSDVVESIIGAIYISDNFSPVGAEALFDNVLKPFYDRHVTLKTLSHHPTKVLFELFQAQGCHQFKVLKEKNGNSTNCQVLVHEVILASCEDSTPTVAARRASLFALDALQGDAMFMYRTCNCRTTGAKKSKAHKDMLEEEKRNLDTEDVLGDVENRSFRCLSAEFEQCG